MLGGDVRRIAFDAEQKLRIHQDRAQRHFDARFEIAFRARLAIELQRRFADPSSSTGRRYARRIRSARICLAQLFFVRRPVGLADENPAAARRVAGPVGLERAGDRNLVDRRRDARMPVQVEVHLIRLPLGFQQRRRILQKRHAQLVRPGRHLDARLQIRVDRLMLLVSAGGLTVNDATARGPAALPARAARSGPRLARCDRASAGSESRTRRPAERCTESACRRACPSGKPFDVLFLREIGRTRNVSPLGDRCGAADRQPADLLRRRDVAIQQRRREIARASTLSKPWLASSAGSSAVASMSSASRSRMAF